MAIDPKITRKLWASSGGFCTKPDCHAQLFPFFEDKKVTNVEELAHIIGQKKKGPRGDDELPMTKRDEFENIILLCPTCHTLIDKNPELFEAETIRKWKSNHESAIKGLFETPIYESREKARENIQLLFAENLQIFQNFGPHSKNAFEDQQSTELMWDRLSFQTLLPNNKKIEKIVEANQKLLNQKEIELFMQFKIHREGFEYNKVSGDVNAAVLRFPQGFEKVFL